MADISDVEDALVFRAAAALYPGGTSAPSAIGAPCRVHRALPTAKVLDDAIAAGVVTVAVFLRAGMGRNTTRFPTEWRAEPETPSGLSWARTALDATALSGTAEPGEVVGVKVHGPGEFAPLTFAHAVLPGDGPDEIVAALRDQSPFLKGVGAELVFPGALRLEGRIARPRMAWRELRREENDIDLRILAPSIELRDAAARAIDAALADVRDIRLADGTEAHVNYRRTVTIDDPQRAAVWVRSLTYRCEHATVERRALPTVLFGVHNGAAV